MKTMFRKRWYFFIPLIIVAFVAFGFVTMHLWNWLMPLLFHLPEITFWQTIGLLVLSRLILGGMGCHGRSHHNHFRQHIHEKWETMTPEEREKFREQMHSRCSPWMRHNSHEEK